MTANLYLLRKNQKGIVMVTVRKLLLLNGRLRVVILSQALFFVLLATRSTFGQYLNMEPLGTVGGRMNRAAISGAYAYISEGWAISAFDLSIPTQPRRVGQAIMPGSVHRLLIAGDFILAGSEIGLHIIDASNPADLKLLDSDLVGMPGRGLAFSGTTAFYYIDYRLYVYDFSDPTNLRRTNDLRFGYINNMNLDGDRIYISDGNRQQILSITNPHHPVVITSNPIANISDIEIVHDIMFIAKRGALEIYNVSDALNPELIISHKVHKPIEKLAIAGNLVILYGNTAYIEIVDITDPSNPAFRGSFESTIRPNELAIQGHLAVMTSGAIGPQIVDFAIPESPSIVGAIPMMRTPNDFLLAGGIAYILDANGVNIVDISDQKLPNIVATHKVLNPGRALAFSGTHLFVADSESGFHVLEANNPYSLVHRASFPDPGDLEVMRIHENKLYCAYEEASIPTFIRISIFDISNVQGIHKIGEFFGYGEVEDLFVQGDEAFLTGEYNDFRIIDVSSPTTPTLSSHTYFPRTPTNLDVEDDLACLAMEGNGVAVVDVSTTDDPKWISSFATAGTAQDVDLENSFAYVAVGSLGLQVFDLRDAETPILRGLFGREYLLSVSDVVVRDRISFALVGDDGLMIVRYTGPGSTPTPTPTPSPSPSPSPTLTPTPTATATPVPIADIAGAVLGQKLPASSSDLNQDGLIDVSDVVSLQQR